MPRWFVAVAFFVLGGGCRPDLPTMDASSATDSGGVDVEVSRDAGNPDGDLASILEPIRAEHGLVALGGAVVDESGAASVGAVGLRRQGGGTRVRFDDRWHLGSDTKAMTATLAAILVEAGEIGWDTTVVDAFPSFAARIHADLRDVTLVELLTHRAGLEADLINRYGAVWSRLWEMRDPIEAERLWFSEQLLSATPAVPPRSAYLYSNAGYIIAGAMLEQATSARWETLIRQRLFEPLEMTSCGFGAPATPGTEDAPWGHSGTSTLSPVPPGPAADNPPALGPAGTVYCSLADWAKFIALHLRGASGDTALLPMSAFARLQSGPGFAPRGGGSEYGYGWEITDRAWAGGVALTHAGSNTMFYAIAWLAPGRKAAYLAVTNQANAAAAPGTDAAIGALIEAFPPTPRGR